MTIYKPTGSFVTQRQPRVSHSIKYFSTENLDLVNNILEQKTRVPLEIVDDVSVVSVVIESLESVGPGTYFSMLSFIFTSSIVFMTSIKDKSQKPKQAYWF